MPVGIVVVCHSATLARGAADLAHAMSADTLCLAVAAGVDDPEHKLGTDPMQVLAAIEEVYSADGVLVLMDLGSAVLSAELAVDMLAPEMAARVRLCEAPLVEGLLAAAVQAVAGADLDTVAREAIDGLAGKRAHLHATPATVTPSYLAANSAPPSHELPLRIDIRQGLHARPAARIVAAVSAHDATVTVANRTTGGGPVSAASLNAIIAIGGRHGHDVLFQASGPQAAQAIQALRELAHAGFGDTVEPSATAMGQPTEPVPWRSTGRELVGLAGSPGLGVGALCLVTEDDAATTMDHRVSTGRGAAEETRRLQAAVAAVGDSLRATADRATSPDVADIIAAQRVMLTDPELFAAAARHLTGSEVDARTAWLRATGEVATTYRQHGDDYLAARAADVEALGRDVARHLDGRPAHPGELRGVVAATDLSPAQTAGLDPAQVTGVVTVQGSPSSHTAIIARTLGIPAVVGLGPALLTIAPGTTVVVDGGAGRVVVEPSETELGEVRTRLAERDQLRTRARERASLPAVTRDGVHVEIRANVGSVDDARLSQANGAAGSGLVRTEFLFLGRSESPSEDEQVRVYTDICAELPGLPVVLRTLDVGGDKPIPYLRQDVEANPYLGLRGIRLALATPHLLATQLRALLRTAARHPVQIMLPMVTGLAEITAVRALLAQQRELLSAQGHAFGEHVPLGVMVETPALALKLDTILPSVDFLSIGTNDLVQYTTAAERGNAAVAHLYDALDPAVLRLVGDVTVRAGEAGTPVAVCGSAAEDEVALTVLIGLGLREFSVPPPRVPDVKDFIRGLDAGRAHRLAQHALRAASAETVRQLVQAADPSVEDPSPGEVGDR